MRGGLFVLVAVGVGGGGTGAAAATADLRSEKVNCLRRINVLLRVYFELHRIYYIFVILYLFWCHEIRKVHIFGLN